MTPHSTAFLSNTFNTVSTLFVVLADRCWSACFKRGIGSFVVAVATVAEVAVRPVTRHEITHSHEPTGAELIRHSRARGHYLDPAVLEPFPSSFNAALKPVASFVAGPVPQ